MRRDVRKRWIVIDTALRFTGPDRTAADRLRAFMFGAFGGINFTPDRWQAAVGAAGE